MINPNNSAKIISELEKKLIDDSINGIELNKLYNAIVEFEYTDTFSDYELSKVVSIESKYNCYCETDKITELKKLIAQNSNLNKKIFSDLLPYFPEELINNFTLNLLLLSNINLFHELIDCENKGVIELMKLEIEPAIVKHIINYIFTLPRLKPYHYNILMECYLKHYPLLTELTTDNILIKYQRIKNMVFTETSFYKVVFGWTSFDGCKFVGVNFTTEVNNLYTYCNFIDCHFSGELYPTEYYPNSMFTNCTFS
jgi:hypothetical protein